MFFWGVRGGGSPPGKITSCDGLFLLNIHQHHGHGPRSGDGNADDAEYGALVTTITTMAMSTSGSEWRGALRPPLPIHPGPHSDIDGNSRPLASTAASTATANMGRMYPSRDVIFPGRLPPPGPPGKPDHDINATS